MAKISKIHIPAAVSTRDTTNRVDFWFSDDIRKWMPKFKGDRVDKRFKADGPWRGQGKKSPTKGKAGAL